MHEPDFSDLPFSVADIISVQVRYIGTTARIVVWPDWSAYPAKDPFIVLEGVPWQGALDIRDDVRDTINAARRLLGRHILD